MLSPFMTWGDVKEMQRQPGVTELLPFGYLVAPEMIEKAKDRHDDEFFFDLSAEMVAVARRERWPRVPRIGESIRHEVTVTVDGEVRLLLLLVDDEKYFYRSDGGWIYIGPGDDIRGFFDEELYEVLPSFVAVFDDQSPSDPGLVIPAVGPYLTNLHEYYLARGRLGYFPYVHAQDGAYLLVTEYAPESVPELETTLFLITNRFWLRRLSGRWQEVDDDQVAGDDGEFRGSLISPLLEGLAVAWWDSLTAAPSFAEALAYCAALPQFRFEVDVSGRLRSLLLEAENATWEVDKSDWRRRIRSRASDVAKLEDIEAFVSKPSTKDCEAGVGGDAAAGPSAGLSQTVLLEGLQLGLLSFVNPSLAAEAREWTIRLQNAGDQTTDLEPFLTSLLLAASVAQFVCDEERIVALTVIAGNVLWKRENGRWIASDAASEPPRLQTYHCVPVNMKQLCEFTAWWDAHCGEAPSVGSVPGHHDHSTIVRYEDVWCRSGLDREHNLSMKDGVREWTRSGGKWLVGPIADDFEEPDFDERLPDWFYKS